MWSLGKNGVSSFILVGCLAGLSAAPALAQTQAQDVPSVALTQSFENNQPRFKIGFPDGWSVFQASPKDVVLRRAQPDGQCSVNWYHLDKSAFGGFSAERASFEFAQVLHEKWVEGYTQFQGGVSPVSSFKGAHKDNENNAVYEFLDVMGASGTGKSLKWYVAVDLVGFQLDCETYTSAFDRLLPAFEAILFSFEVPRDVN